MYTPILPSSLLAFKDPSEFDISKKFINNTTLKVGVVIDVLEIDNDANITKQGPEYNVMVVEQDKDGGINSTSYRNCLHLDMFGGIGEFFDCKLHAPEKKDAVVKSGTLTKNNNGTIVLLLCLDGNTEKGVIIGAIQHPGRKTTLTKEAGKHLEGEFNGINWKINKDGEFTVTYKSKTDNNGKPIKDEKTGGTFIKVDKTGSVELSDGKTESIKVDKTAQTINIKAEKDIVNTTKANFNISAEKNIAANCKMDLIMQAEGKADLIIKKDMNLEVSKALTVKCQMLDLKADSMVKIQTKQIQIEGQQVEIKAPMLNIEGTQVAIKAAQISLGNGGTPALTMTTKFMGFVGPVPVISTAIGPFSTVVLIA